MLLSCAPSFALPAVANARHEYSARQICAKRTCRTLAADRNVRVFQATDRHGYDVIYGEWLPTRQVRLITLPRSEPITAMRLVGSNFAYAERYESGTAVLIYESDLRPRGAGVSWLGAEDLERGGRGVTQLTLNSSGVVAWLIEGRFRNPADVKEGSHAESRAIFVAPRLHGQPVLLAYGDDISPHSLTSTRRRIYWTQAGARHSYTLP
ncbi:MAG: hypothetical protein ACYDHT_00915 [Solirubrobacteraceae bacterium]